MILFQSHRRIITQRNGTASGVVVIRSCSSCLLLVLACFASESAAQDRVGAADPTAIKAEFQRLLDRPRVPPDTKVEMPASEEEGLLMERLSIATERKRDGTVERVPVLVVRPATLSDKRPAVIVLHGTGGNKESQKPFLVELARRNMIGVAIDARYHGARVPGVRGSAAYVEAITRAWKTPAGEPHEYPFYYDTCWDLWRTVDYLQSRPDVDPARLGMIGFSMGGIQTWLAAAVDDRIKVAVPAIAVQSFRWSLEHGQWQGRAKTIAAAHQTAAQDLGETMVNARVCRELWNKVIPGMLDQFDCPSMIRLFAGRPLLILNGDMDPNCPIEGARIVFESARAAYRAAGASDKLHIDLAKGVGHKVTDDQKQLAFDWLQRWLER